MELVKRKKGFYERYVKRPQDFCLALGALLVFGVPLLLIAYRVKNALGTPVLFKQERPGLNEQVFRMYKFRTMTNEKDSSGNLMPDETRLTSFGKMLRSTSIDELPGLWNVIKGDMALVGPRPLLVQYLSRYNSEQKRRHEVRPGLSGWAQVNGRNAISWDEKFKLDVHYVDNINFFLDWKIIFLTLKKVFIKEGISSGTSETMEEFRG